MSEADSITPSPRRGMNGSSDGSVVAAPEVGISDASRPASRSQSSSGLDSSTSRWGPLAPWLSSALTSDSACSTSWPAADRSISAATLTSSRKRATARSTSAAASRRISPSCPPTWATVSSSSSRMIRKVECRPSAGPNSSSSIDSSAADSAAARVLQRLRGSRLARLGPGQHQALARAGRGQGHQPAGALAGVGEPVAVLGQLAGHAGAAARAVGQRAGASARPRTRGRTRARGRRRCPAPAPRPRARGPAPPPTPAPSRRPPAGSARSRAGWRPARGA